MHQMNSQYNWTWIGYRNVKVYTATHNPIYQANNIRELQVCNDNIRYL